MQQVLLRWSEAIADQSLLLTGVVVPCSTLELMHEVKHEQRMLEVNEDEAAVHSLLALIVLIRNILDRGVSVGMRAVDLDPELFLAVAARQVLDAEVRPQVLAGLDPLDVDDVLDLDRIEARATLV